MNAITLASFFLLSLLMASCDACSKRSIPKTTQVVDEKKNSRERFLIDSESLLKNAANFIYRSELLVSIGQGDTQKDNREIVELKAHAPRMLFEKKIDDFHFFKIFRDDDNFLVQNLNGPWRKTNDNALMYKELIHDGINLTAWLVEQFDLDKQLVAKSDNQTFYVSNKPLAPNAPFLLSLKEKNRQFSVIRNSAIEASIEIDQNLGLLKTASFDIKIFGKEDYWLKMSAKITAHKSQKHLNLAAPVANVDEPPLVPVNLVPRFQQLMEVEKGEK